MPVAVKKLYMASNLKELREKSAIPSFNKHKKGSKVENLIKSFNLLYKTAHDAINQVEQDEELAYMYLYRAMELWQIILNEYQDKKYLALMHGKEVSHVMELLEIYTAKLEKRYADLLNGAKESNDILNQFKFTSSIQIKKRKESKGEKAEDMSLNGFTNHSLPENNYVHQDDHKLVMKLDIAEPINESDYYGDKKFLQCDELKEQFMPSIEDVLLIDIRPKKDFDMSKIINVHSVNIPAAFITVGNTAVKLGGVISKQEEKHFWKQRDKYKQIVLMDWNSEEKDVIPSSPLVNLQNILLKWDPDVVYENKPLILNGGFERWLDMYPTLTTNPKIQCPQKPTSPKFIHLSEHIIEYPINELDEIIVPKTKVTARPAEVHRPTPKPSFVPNVDRSTKPDTTVEKVYYPEEPVQNTGVKETERVKPSSQEENGQEEQVSSTTNFEFEDSPLPSSPIAASKGRPAEKTSDSGFPYSSVISSTPVQPAIPPRPKDYPTTPEKSTEKGNGDGDILLEKLKFDTISRSGGLKRSASSPNIKELTDEENSKPYSTPKYDRSTKPSNYETYSPRATDTVYLANKQGRGLTGLKNLGNLCYMNSIMQCMSNTVELTKELTRFNTNEISSKRQIASEVSSLLRSLWQGDARITTCRNLKMRVGALRNSFSTMEQQDSHEFLTILLDWLHEDLNEPRSNTILNGAEESTGEKAWGEFLKKNKSIVLNLFYGQLKSTVTCTHCQKKSIQFEPFSNLSVPLPTPQDMSHDKDRTFTLEECLKLYVKGEVISGWTCPSCKTQREATKRLEITRLPPVLIIHLKRFLNDMVGVGWCRKRMNMVEFPINDLDMKPFTHDSSELRFHNYNLYAVSNHYGSMDSGHYTAYCKNHILNKWYKFDDHDVNEMSPLDVRSSAAYILFYEST